MGRDFGGILGPLVFVTVILRGVLIGSGLVSSVQLALICMFLFAAIGYIVGNIAEQVITESVQTKINAELDALEQSRNEGSATSG